MARAAGNFGLLVFSFGNLSSLEPVDVDKRLYDRRSMPSTLVRPSTLPGHPATKMVSDQPLSVAIVQFVAVQAHEVGTDHEANHS